MLGPMFAVGCARDGDAPLIISEEVERLEAVAPLRGQNPTTDDFDRAFVPIDSFNMSARFIADRGGLWDTSEIDVSLMVSGWHTLRMRAVQPGDGAELFDVLIDKDVMRVYVRSSESLLDGMLPTRGTAFSRRYGVEPWELVPMILIGRRLATLEWHAVPGPEVTLLLPAETDSVTDGLAVVEIERASGLPIRARWVTGVGEVLVEYRAWDLFGDSESGERRWLMPTHFIVHRPETNVRLEIKPRENVTHQYQINPRSDEQPLNLYVPQGTAVAPLEDLATALKGK